jgi:hypothetical protein
MIIHPDPRDGVALAAFKSEWWPASRRNSGRLQIGTPGRLRRNTQTRKPIVSRSARFEGRSRIFIYAWRI